VQVVSQRLGHASPTVTLSVCAHVMPGNQRDAAELSARRVREGRCLMRSGKSVAERHLRENYKGLNCADVVSEGGLEPPCPFGALAPQASASAYSATRTRNPGVMPEPPHDSKSGPLPATALCLPARSGPVLPQGGKAATMAG
jgi:hypothetical protein